MLYRVTLDDPSCYNKFIEEKVITINYNIEKSFINNKSYKHFDENQKDKVSLINEIEIYQKIKENDLLLVNYLKNIFVCKVISITKFSDDDILLLIGVKYHDCSKVLSHSLISNFNDYKVQIIKDSSIVEEINNLYLKLNKGNESTTNDFGETSIEFVRKNRELVPLKKAEIVPYNAKKRAKTPDRIRIMNNFGDLIIELYGPDVEDEIISSVPAIIKRNLPANGTWTDFYIKLLRNQLGEYMYRERDCNTSLMDMYLLSGFLKVFK